MAKRSDYERVGERVKVEEEEMGFYDEIDEEPSEASETVRLVLLKDIKLNYTGPFSGKLYTFSKAGAEVDVDADDAEIMLAKRGGMCCEGSGIGVPQPYFAIVE